MLDADALIVSTPDTLSGAHRVEGTRISAALILSCLAQGMSHEKIHETYPTLPLGAVRAVLTFASRLLEDADEWAPREVLPAGRVSRPQAG